MISNKTDMAKICEVAVIYGQLYEMGVVKGFEDLEEAHEQFSKIYEDWSNFVDIKNNEEEGYISAYAQRVLTEKFKIG
jgi:hypothetical protein